MPGFSESYLGQLRSKIGSGLLIVAGNRAIIEDKQGKVLLMLRSDFKMWGLPSGSVEVGESAKTSMKREILEETGLRAERLIPVGLASEPQHETITFPNGHKIQNFSLMWHVSVWKGSLQSLDTETQALEFFDLSNLPPIISNHSRSIEYFKKYKYSSKFQLF